MRTIIAGSRGVTDYEVILNAMDCAFHAGIEPSVILSGNARGADILGECWAQANGLPVEIYPAEWNKYGKGAGFKRNALMASKADALVALWDGESRGTGHMIDMANAMNLLVVVYKVPKYEG